MQDFKENGFMIALGLGIVALILAQSLSFLIHAWRRGKKLGLDSRTMRSTIISSALFTVTPALAIVATVLALAPALGIVLPWMRLTVIGNIMYETTAASAAVEAAGAGGLGSSITDPAVFTTVAWVMTVGSISPLIILPIVLKTLKKKMNKVTAAKDPKLIDALSAAAFIGLIAVFVARSLIGQDTGKTVDGVFMSNGDGAGVLSVATLISAVIFMLILGTLAEKKNIRWLKDFAMPISMFAALGVCVLLSRVLPESIANLEWRPVAAAITAMGA
ncbi:MAG: DUF5058 family protein [Clostridia bacterium]|nr:DUF5058 family protein [Clostridia bacterium]